jgi:FkbM family methyltransferase
MQPLLLTVLKFCHAGLNYGGGQSVAVSGETGALRFVCTRTDDLSPFVLFDIGANEGEYLNAAVATVGTYLTAYCFEPQSASFQKLRIRFSDDSRITLIQMAVGSDLQPVELFFESDGAVGATLHRDSISGQQRSEMVAQTTIDQFCKQERIEKIDLLKIDTEGHEMDVLHGAAGMIESGSIHAVQFEFGETFLHTQYHFIDVWALLSSRYAFYRILRRGLAEVHQYSPDLEIYKLANFLCVQKHQTQLQGRVARQEVFSGRR